MENEFWIIDKDSVRILHSELIEFLNKNGFAKVISQEYGFLLVHIENSLVRVVSEVIITDFLIEKIKEIEEHKTVLETFARGVSTYCSRSKLQMLQTVVVPKLRDGTDTIFFYFQDFAIRVLSDRVEEFVNKQDDALGLMWTSSIIQRKYLKVESPEMGEFERFTLKICNYDEDRKKSLMSIIGYLLHRYQDKSSMKAVILIDEQIGDAKEANGGTGKGIIATAIGHCRNIVIIDGRRANTHNRFEFQRVESSTDIIFYDDVKRDFNLEKLYSIITSGIVVEKKHKAEVYISSDDSPKVLISSNYMVKGNYGSTDKRRRIEFEVAPYYSDIFTPADDFGKLFFHGWDDHEWSRFFNFMIRCAQLYLQSGIIKPKPINLIKNKIADDTCPEFLEFMSIMYEEDTWLDKRVLEDLFRAEYEKHREISAHHFWNFLNKYSKILGLQCEKKSKGGKYLVRFTKNSPE